MKHITQATQAGYEAAINNQMRAPALNTVIRSLIATNVFTHAETMNIFQAFVLGYETRITEVCNAMLAEEA
jgi:hypothetical protein